MQEQGISESRFYMWRAVFAMAHADGKVVPKELAFIENYLQYVPFSDSQRKAIMADVERAQEVGAMLSRVTEPEDQGQFFQFAKMLVWCDGDYDENEQAAVEAHLQEQMDKFNLPHMKENLRMMAETARLQRSAEDARMKEAAEKAVGLGAMLKGIFS